MPTTAQVGVQLYTVRAMLADDQSSVLARLADSVRKEWNRSARATPA